MASTPQPHLTARQQRVHRSLARLRAHPAVNPPPASPPLSPTVPGSLIRALFDDLVKRELHCGAPAAVVERHLRKNRAVAPRPSLSDSQFVTRLARGASAELLGGKLAAEVGGVKVDCEALSPTVAQIHKAIREAREVKRGEEKRARMEAAKAATAHGDGDIVGKRVRLVGRKAARLEEMASKCCFCPALEAWGGEELKSELVGPFVDRRGRGKLFVHFDCACWAPQVFADVKSGQLRGVYDEHKRGRRLNCCNCGGKGATIGCYVKNCKRVFHFRCLEPAGAYRVERFFVAFCANHAHLGKKRSYQILMEAATIADVAASRREDTTVGLDAPHSRYTMLRRSETEVIFSRQLGVCSHSGAYETAKLVFSHRRRAILKKSDRLSIADGTRALLVSAFDVASGRLAYMSVAGNEKNTIDMTAVEARAALASRENTSLFLLRNLRHAPTWTKEQIKIVKNSGGEPVGKEVVLPVSGSDRSNHLSILPFEVTHRDTAKEINEKDLLISPGEENEVITSAEEDPTSDYSPHVRQSKRRRVGSPSESEDGKTNLASTPVQASESHLSSVTLPSFKKNTVGLVLLKLRIKAPAGIDQDSGSEGASSPPEQQDKGTPLRDCLSDKRLPKSSPKRRRGALSISKEGQNARKGLDGKIKTAWETFLEEQLLNERLLRPDDSETEALRNMARLWSLLSVEARDKYQERGRRAGTIGGASDSLSKDGEPTDENDQEQTHKYSSISCVAKGDGTASASRLMDAGLFAGKTRSREVQRGAVGKKEKNKRSDSKRQPSVALPRRPRDHERSQRASRYAELVAVDWDDLFVTSLDGNLARSRSEDLEPERVREPPSRGRKS